MSATLLSSLCSAFDDLRQRIDAMESTIKQSSESFVGDITVDYMMRLVAMRHGFSVEDLRSNRRQQHLADARAEAMWVIRRARPRLTLQAIGRLFNRDHGTVIYSIRKVDSLRMIYEDVADRTDELLHKCK